INNPLALIQLAADQLQAMCDNTPIDQTIAKKNVDRILQSVARIGKITSGLRIFSRDGSVDSFEQMSVKKLIEETLSFNFGKMKQRAVSYTIDPIAEDLKIQGRPTELSQVLVNLISNAIDAVDGLSDKWIQVSATDKDTFIQISITDSGSGIPESIR